MTTTNTKPQKKIIPSVRINRCKQHASFNSAPRFIVFRKGILRGEFQKLITEDSPEKTVTAIYDIVKDNTSGASLYSQIAYEGDIVLSCLGLPDEPRNYRASVIVPRKINTDGSAVVAQYGRLPGQKESIPTPMDLVIAVCRNKEICDYLSNPNWVPTDSFLIKGKTVKESKEIDRAYKQRFKNKKRPQSGFKGRHPKAAGGTKK